MERGKKTVVTLAYEGKRGFHDLEGEILLYLEQACGFGCFLRAWLWITSFASVREVVDKSGAFLLKCGHF